MRPELFVRCLQLITHAIQAHVGGQLIRNISICKSKSIYIRSDRTQLLQADFDKNKKKTTVENNVDSAIWENTHVNDRVDVIWASNREIVGEPFWIGKFPAALLTMSPSDQ